jgi:hypothetical protein
VREGERGDGFNSSLIPHPSSLDMVTPTPIFFQSVRREQGQVLPADASALKTLFTAGANGSRIVMISFNSTDTADRDVTLYITSSGVDYPWFTLKVLANAGNTNAIPAVDGMRHLNNPALAYDPGGNRYLDLKSGDVLKMAALTTVTAAKAITALVGGADL